jgi:acetylglutamate kinase
LYNINADLAAGALAAALKASRLLVLTNVRGLYREFGREESFVARLGAGEARTLIANGSASAGMIPKLEGVLTALEGGAAQACLVDGRRPDALLRAFRDDPECGTVIVAERV